jgi:hypothetical protein
MVGVGESSAMRIGGGLGFWPSSRSPSLLLSPLLSLLLSSLAASSLAAHRNDEQHSRCDNGPQVSPERKYTGTLSVLRQTLQASKFQINLEHEAWE